MANPNPDQSGLVPFKPGQSGNPGGKTREQRRLEVENAEKATRIRAALLDRIVGQIDEAQRTKITGDGDPDWKALKDLADLALTGNLLRLIKDSEDRGLGQPVQPISHSLSDLSDEEVDAQLAALAGEAAVAPARGQAKGPRAPGGKKA